MVSVVVTGLPCFISFSRQHHLSNGRLCSPSQPNTLPFAPSFRPPLTKKSTNPKENWKPPKARKKLKRKKQKKTELDSPACFLCLMSLSQNVCLLLFSCCRQQFPPRPDRTTRRTLAQGTTTSTGVSARSEPAPIRISLSPDGEKASSLLLRLNRRPRPLFRRFFLTVPRRAKKASACTACPGNTRKGRLEKLCGRAMFTSIRSSDRISVFRMSRWLLRWRGGRLRRLSQSGYRSRGGIGLYEGFLCICILSSRLTTDSLTPSALSTPFLSFACTQHAVCLFFARCRGCCTLSL